MINVHDVSRRYILLFEHMTTHIYLEIVPLLTQERREFFFKYYTKQYTKYFDEIF